MPEVELASLFSGRAGVRALWMLAGSCLLFASLAPNALSNGDDAVYAQQIKSFDFSHRTTHLGYYLLASPLALLAPDFSDYSLNALSALFGALTIAAVALLTQAISGSPAAAAGSGIFLLTNYVFVHNCIFAEVYISQTFFLVLSVCFWLYQRPIAGGLAFGFSTLITPSTLFAAPAFVVLRPKLGPLVRFGAAAALLLALCLSWAIDDYLFGGRGLLKATGSAFDLKAAVLKEGLEAVVGISAWLPLLLLGAHRLIVRAQLRRLGLALLAIWLFTFVFAERFGDVPVQLPTYALLGAVVGLGLERLTSWLRQAETGRRRYARVALFTGAAAVPVGLAAAARPFSDTLQRLPGYLPAAVAGMLVAAAAAVAWWRFGKSSAGVFAAAVLMLGCGSMAVTLILNQRAENVRYRESVLQAGSVAQPRHLALGTWTQGVLFSHYLHARPYHESWLDVRRLEGAFGESHRAESRQRWRSALASGHEIWFLGHHPTYVVEARSRHFEIEPFGAISRARRPPPAP